jgi:hypothetical protein
MLPQSLPQIAPPVPAGADANAADPGDHHTGERFFFQYGAGKNTPGT